MKRKWTPWTPAPGTQQTKGHNTYLAHHQGVTNHPELIVFRWPARLIWCTAAPYPCHNVIYHIHVKLYCILTRQIVLSAFYIVLLFQLVRIVAASPGQRTLNAPLGALFLY